MVGKRMLADDDLDFIRVAKHDNQVIAAYRFKQVSPSVFEICYLRVEEAFQGQGLGSWLLAHAIGIIESKGGREVITRCKQRTLFARVGFKQGLSDRLRLTLIPEQAMVATAIDLSTVPHVADGKVVLLTSKWHAQYVRQMEAHCRRVLNAHGVSEVITRELPGTLEMPVAASMLIDKLNPDAVVCLSVVQKGDTAHFDMIVHATTKALIEIAVDKQVPIINEIIAANSIEQVIERASDNELNKGIEAAAATLEMMVFVRKHEAH